MRRPKQNTGEYIKLNRKFEVKYMPSVKRALDLKVGAAINQLRSGGVNAVYNHLNLDFGNNRMAEVVERIYLEVGLRHARRNEIRLRAKVNKKSYPSVRQVKELEEMQQKRLGFNDLWTQFIKLYLQRFLIDKITFKVNETLRAALLRVMQQAIEEGWGIDETVARLKNTELTKFQAARIVRTEINRAANVGVKAQGESFEFELMKEWISVHDFRTRGRNPEDHANHWALDGKTVDLNEKFIDPRNGDQLDIPGDPTARAESTINCRCNMATIPKRDENGRLIPKRGTERIAIPNRRRQIFIR